MNSQSNPEQNEPTQNQQTQNQQSSSSSSNSTNSSDFTSSNQSSFIKSSSTEPNYVAGTLAGAGAAIVCAGIWAGITYITNFQLGLMAIALGCAVGIAVKRFGKATAKPFGIIASVEALLGCVLGNLLVICLVLSKQLGVPFVDIMLRLTPGLVAELMEKSFDAMDLLFYGIAVYEAYKLSTAPEQKLQEQVQKAEANKPKL